MAFRQFAGKERGVDLLQRSLERGRLGHAYLFAGGQLEQLELLAMNLAKTLNCKHPQTGASGLPIDCCDECVNCRKVANLNHADVYWVRPESKSRVIVIEQIRDLAQSLNLKPTESEYKVAMIVGADRLNVAAANAFLKTLEEPPSKSILVLLSTEPTRLLETIISRCLRLTFGVENTVPANPALMEWLKAFSELAAGDHKSLLARYRLLDLLLQYLTGLKAEIEESMEARSPLSRYEDAEKDLRDKWEAELAAAVEAEYRRRRSELLTLLQWWFRDIWLQSIGTQENRSDRESMFALSNLPGLEGAQKIGKRLSVEQALANLEQIETLQRLLNTNVQEALALEVGLLKLHL